MAAFSIVSGYGESMLKGVVTHILLVDARTISRFGLRALVEGESDLRLVGEVADVREAPARTAPLSPHVVVFDGHSDTAHTARMLRWLAAHPMDERPNVLALIDDFDGEGRQLLEGGVRGVLLSRSTPEEIVAAIRMVAAGYRLLIPFTCEEPADTAADWWTKRRQTVRM
ncbi:hypothetical protein NKH77_03810 [Streptomyces sp. M19]